MAYLYSLCSISFSLKVDGAPSLGAPILTHHNVGLQHPPNGLEQVLQLLPGICKRQALDDDLQSESSKCSQSE